MAYLFYHNISTRHFNETDLDDFAFHYNDGDTVMISEAGNAIFRHATEEEIKEIKSYKNYKEE